MYFLKRKLQVFFFVLTYTFSRESFSLGLLLAIATLFKVHLSKHSKLKFLLSDLSLTATMLIYVVLINVCLSDSNKKQQLTVLSKSENSFKKHVYVYIRTKTSKNKTCVLIFGYNVFITHKAYYFFKTLKLVTT